jgi:hypothetical protein
VDIAEKYERWIHALRTTGEPQACGVMHDGCGYCVYGIMELELYDELFTPGPTAQLLQDEFGWNDSLGMNVEPHLSRIKALELDVAPTEQELWLAHGFFVPKSIARNRLGLLGQLNDAGVPFGQIADFMEECGWGTTLSVPSYPAMLASIYERRSTA